MPIARRINRLPMPRLRQSSSTASGPRSKAGRPGPAQTCQSRTVPTTFPSCSAISDSPAAGLRSSRSRSAVFSNRDGPQTQLSNCSRASTSRQVSLRIVTTAHSIRPLSASSVCKRLVVGAGVTPAPVTIGCGNLNMEGLQRREAVESDRRIGRRVGTGPFDQHFVADLKAYRQRVRHLFVEHVGRIAGRSCKHAWAELAIARSSDGIADRLVYGFGKAAEFADVEIDPAHVVVLALLRDEHDLGLDRTGIADQPAARLDNSLWDAVAEMAPQRAEDRRAVGFHRRHVLEVLGRKTAAQVDHRQRHAALAAFAEYSRRGCERPVPGMRVTLLGADVERDAVSFETKLMGMLEHVGRHGRLAAELPR